MTENPHRPIDWPPHAARRVPWSQEHRSGSREDRMLREVTVAVPPNIAEVDVHLGSDAISTMEEAAREIVALDHERGAELQLAFKPQAAFLTTG